MRAIAIAAFATLALAACSKSDQAEVKEDLKAVTADVREDLKETAGSAAVADLRAEASDAAKDTGEVLKKGASELREGVQDTAAMARAKADEERAKTTTTTTTTKSNGDTTTTVERR